MELATGVTDADRKAVLLKKWLPLKLNAAARMILKSCNLAADWEVLIAEFKSKLVTPQEKYSWRSGKKKTIWNGRESFHVLAERAKRTVDRYEDDPREKDYFQEFRQALPRNYQQAIDYGIEGAETLEKAKKIALRLQAALSGSEPDESAGAVGGKSVSFVGGSMSEDWMDSMERGIQKLTVSMENQGAKIAKIRKATLCGYDSYPNDYHQDYRLPHESSHSSSSDRWRPSPDEVPHGSHPHDGGPSHNRRYNDSTRDRVYDGLPLDRQLDHGSSRQFPYDNGNPSNRRRDYDYTPSPHFEYDNSSDRQSNNSSSSNRWHDDSFSSDPYRSSEPCRHRDNGNNDYHSPPSSYQW